jgi:hypothetical protein
MNKQETAQKIFNFCQKTYPELKWSFTSLTKTQDMIYGYRPILNSINGIQIDIKVNSNNSYSSDGSPSDFRNYIDGRTTISNLDWEGSFLIWINDRKNSKILFKKSGTAKHKELNLWREKGTQIMINILSFIENEIQTEVTP